MGSGLGLTGDQRLGLSLRVLNFVFDHSSFFCVNMDGDDTEVGLIGVGGGRRHKDAICRGEWGNEV